MQYHSFTNIFYRYTTTIHHELSIRFLYLSAFFCTKNRPDEIGPVGAGDILFCDDQIRFFFHGLRILRIKTRINNKMVYFLN